MRTTGRFPAWWAAALLWPMYVVAQAPQPTPTMNLPKIPVVTSSDYLVDEQIGTQYDPGLASLPLLQQYFIAPIAAVNGVVYSSGSGTFTPATGAQIASTFGNTTPGPCFLTNTGSCSSAAGTGTMLSYNVTTTGAPGLSASACSTTTAATCALSWTTGLTANEFLATPSGSTGAVALRAITTADLPLINLATGVTGVAGSTHGGTGENNAGTITAPYNIAFTGSGPVTFVGAGATTATLPAGTVSLGYLGMPPMTGVILTASRTNTASDAGEMGIYNCSSSGSCTDTIPANASVAYPLGTTLGFHVPCSATNSLTITIGGTDTLYFSTGATGARTMAPCGLGSAYKDGTTTWQVDGNNITKRISAPTFAAPALDSFA